MADYGTGRQNWIMDLDSADQIKVKNSLYCYIKKLFFIMFLGCILRI